MKNTIILTCFVCFTFSLFSQQIIRCHDENGISLPYAHCIVKSNPVVGFIADERGIFSIQGNSFQSTDTCIISHLGYRTQKVLLVELLENNKVQLVSKAKELSEVLVYSQNKFRWEGNIQKKYKTLICKDYGSEIGIKVLPKKDGDAIAEVSFMVGKKGIVDAPFGLRIYSIGDYGLPGTSLLDTNIVLRASKPNTWINYQFASPVLIPPNVCL